MSATMRIVNGQVYDPKNNINGEIKEICIQDGKIVDAVDAVSYTHLTLPTKA